MKLPQSTEHEIQCQLVQWCEIVGVPIVAIPNGGHRHIAVAARMKREGVRAGFPDLFVPIAREEWHGLFVDFPSRFFVAVCVPELHFRHSRRVTLHSLRY